MDKEQQVAVVELKFVEPRSSLHDYRAGHEHVLTFIDTEFKLPPPRPLDPAFVMDIGNGY
jgi:hypothetical protein